MRQNFHWAEINRLNMWCVFPLLMEACLDFETDPKAVVVLYMMRIMR